ncbi:MAG: hypothetical protein A2Y07_00450 [Planctomycetes bacterium GWF2_50_10]|nr:MAG: hypothetical protein A2Y07_00450 [Planctomycetes bacterium GWF2_50_10]
MSNKALIILGVLAAVMVVWAVAQSRVSSEQAAVAAANAPLVPGLDTEAIGSISLKSGATTVTLAREGGKFVIGEKSNYPALNSKVNKLITTVLDLKTAELVTKDKANFADLGVSDDKAKTIVTFYKPDKSVLTGVVIGGNSQQGRGTYVKLLGSDDVFLTTESPWLETGALDYVEKNLVELQRNDVASIAVKTAGGAYTLVKDVNDKIVANGIEVPAQKKLKSDVADQVFGAAVSMSFEDVIPAALAKYDFNRSMTIKMKDPTVYTVDVADANGKYYVKVSADYTDKAAVTKENSVETPEQLKAKEAKLLARDKADNFTKKHAGWVYEIPEYKGKELAKSPAEFLEDLPKPAVDANSPADANSAVPVASDANE